MLDEDSNVDVLIDIDNDQWLEWYSEDQWHIQLHKVIQQTLLQIGFSAKSEVSILLTNNDEVHKLNKQFRNVDKPTNVLSFPNLTDDELSSMSKNSPYPIMLGDLALAFETILNESMLETKTFLDHFNHLIVHGMLHLLGYDHEADDDAEYMKDKEIMILKTLNVSNPYQ